MGRAATARIWALVLLAAPLGANPVGHGSLGIQGFRDMVVLEQIGTLDNGGIPIQVAWRRPFGHGASGFLVFPLGERFSASLAAGGGESRELVHANIGWSNALEYSRNLSNAWGRAALSVYPAAWVKPPFDDALNGNPDGYLFWPVLELRSTYRVQSLSYTFDKATGAYAGQPPIDPHEQRIWNHAGSLTLPLNRRFSLGMHYSRDGDVHTRQGGASNTRAGWFEQTGASINLYLPLWHREDGGDPDQYFHRVGWPGEARLGLSAWRWYNLIAGRMSQQSWVADLTMPVHPALAFSLAAEWVDFGSAFFDGYPDMRYTQRGTSTYFLSLGATINFSGLPWLWHRRD